MQAPCTPDVLCIIGAVSDLISASGMGSLLFASWLTNRTSCTGEKTTTQSTFHAFYLRIFWCLYVSELACLCRIHKAPLWEQNYITLHMLCPFNWADEAKARKCCLYKKKNVIIWVFTLIFNVRSLHLSLDPLSLLSLQGSSWQPCSSGALLRCVQILQCWLQMLTPPSQKSLQIGFYFMFVLIPNPPTWFCYLASKIRLLLLCADTYTFWL